MKSRLKEIEEENHQLRKQFSDLEIILFEKEATIQTYQESFASKVDEGTEKLINSYIENEEKYKRRIKDLDKDLKKYSLQISELTATFNQEKLKI